MITSRDIINISQHIRTLTGGKTKSVLNNNIENEHKFHGILTDEVNGMQNVSYLPPDSITKEKLLLLIHAVQIQINSRLYNTVLNNALESNSLALKVLRDYVGGPAQFIEEPSRNKSVITENRSIDPNTAIDDIVNQAAQKYNVDADLIRSVIHAESSFNPFATSPAGAMGLMQLMPDTAKEMGVRDAYDVRENVMAGTRYLKMLLDRYDGEVDLALAAYNWGMGNLEKRPDHLPQETLSYIDRVKSNYKSLNG